MDKNDIREEENTGADNITFSMNADENMSGDNHLNEPMEESEVEKLQEELSNMNDKYLRQAAEFDNFKRRNARERVEMIQTAGKEVITEMLDVLDDSERAAEQLDSATDIEDVRKGISLVFAKLKNTLQSKGLKEMDALDKEFNPDWHEGISEIDAGDDKRGKVVAVVQKGYFLNDKIIRFAKVVVGK